MKKLLLSAAVVAFGLVSAQKGTVLVGGNIAFENQKIEDNKANEFTFAPKVGYQFTNNITAGIEGSYGNANAKVASVKVADYDTYSIGAFGRYTKPLSETFAVFADLGLGYLGEKDKMDGGDKASGMYADLTPALFINFKKSFGLNFSIGGIRYENLSWDKADVTENGFKLNFGKTLNIGISKNF